MAIKGWSRAFDDPIALPDGGTLLTLRDAGNYIVALSRRVEPSYSARKSRNFATSLIAILTFCSLAGD
jgi:hypothetical protein